LFGHCPQVEEEDEEGREKMAEVRYLERKVLQGETSNPISSLLLPVVMREIE
jgi:hypothetical protein